MSTGRALGRWLFQNRSGVPLPLIGVELLVGEPRWLLIGLAVTLMGEAIRLWAVGHIGPRSRTRGEDTWGVVDTGPYARVRNPLYLGNGLMFIGVGLACGPLWALTWIALLGTHYSLVVRWEEANLSEKIGDPYKDYLARVPRWFPIGPQKAGGSWDAQGALRSERWTIVAIVVVYGILVARTFL